MLDLNKIIKSVDSNLDMIHSGQGEGRDNDIYIWRQWYKGCVPTFHNYQIYNGMTKVDKHVLNMQGGQMVCRAWATLLMNERVKIGLKDKEQTKVLAEQFKKDQIYSKFTKTIEQAFALSTASMAIDFSNIVGKELSSSTEEIGNMEITSSKIISSSFNAWNTVPLETIDGEVTQACFKKKLGGKKVRYILHVKNENDNYDMIIIDKVEGKKGGDIYHILLDSPYKLFTVIYPNEVNNQRFENVHTSILANIIPKLMMLDNAGDGLNTEFKVSKKRMFISTKLSSFQYKSDATGAKTKVVSTFDPNDDFIYALPGETSGLPGVNGKELIHETGGTLRVDEYQKGIQLALNLVSKGAGLGNGYFNFDRQGVITATQVISENSDTYNNLKRHELVLGDCIREFTRAWMFIQNALNKGKYTIDQDIIIDFDDSIIEDKQSEKIDDAKDVAAGIMSKVEYRMKWYNESEATAKKNINKFFGDDVIANKLAKFQDAYSSGNMSTKLFVKLVYGDTLSEAEQLEQIEALDSKREAASEEDMKSAFVAMSTDNGVLDSEDSEEDNDNNEEEE